MPSPSYLALLRLPGARAFTAAALVGRMPLAMIGIGSVLLVEDRRGSYALAGAVAAASALGAALGGPRVARLVDRRGQRAVLPWCLGVFAAALAALVGAAGSALPAAALLLLAALSGGALPPLGSCVRARWTHALTGSPERVGTAMAWESVVDELVFISGPAVVVVLARALDPAAGLLTALALGAAGTGAFLALRASEPPVHERLRTAVPAIRFPGLRTATLAMVFVGVVFGGLEVGMVAFAQQHGSPGAAGYLLPLIALGSAGAGLVYGTRRWRAPLERRFVAALLGLAVGLVPVVLAPGVPAMAPAALLAGLAVSPTLITGAALTERLVPPALRTEGFTWLNSGLGVGVAGGSAVSGAVADSSGARAAFGACLAGAVVALLVALARRATLRLPAPLSSPPAPGAPAGR